MREDITLKVSDGFVSAVMNGQESVQTLLKREFPDTAATIPDDFVVSGVYRDGDLAQYTLVFSAN